MKTIAFTIDESELERIDRAAAKKLGKRRNRSQVIRRAVAEYMNRLERQARDEREDKIVRRIYKKLNRQAAALIREQAKL